MAKPIDRSDLTGHDIVSQARGLLGTTITTRDADGTVTTGRIVETEAYRGRDDRASHAYPLKRTPRTAVMFGPPGHAYVYLCYGIHRMFNVVVGPIQEPNAILIRAIEPLVGTATMLQRRKLPRVQRRVGGGPGLVCQALAIELSDNTSDLFAAPSRLALGGTFAGFSPKQVLASPRVGVAYAGECAARPWRFRIRNNVFTSPAQ